MPGKSIYSALVEAAKRARENAFTLDSGVKIGAADLLPSHFNLSGLKRK
jgi:hypothetical protein